MSGETGREAEIEVTEEMIEAGVRALVSGIAPSRVYAPMTEERVATLVFRAMLGARRHASPKERNQYVPIDE